MDNDQQVIRMKSAPMRITEVIRVTKASMYCNLKVGDVVQVSTEARNRTGASGGSSYAAGVRVTCLNTNAVRGDSMNQFCNVFYSTFRYELIVDETPYEY